MRILYITHLTERNGSTIALRNIMKGMVERGVEVGLVAPSSTGYLCKEAEGLGIQVLHNFPYPWALIKGQVSLKKYLLSHWKIYKLINQFQPDIVHCNNSIIDYSLLGCLLTHTPMVWHAREYINKDFGQEVQGGMTLLSRKMKLPFVHCVAITNGVFQHYKLKSPKDIIIYDGVINPNDPVSVTLDVPSYKYFLFVGSLTKGKGAHIIFEQFGTFFLRHPDIHLCLACSYNKDDKFYQYCIGLAEQGGFVENIHFLGFRTDVYNLMRNSVALIVPSQFEGFGFITVEAMYNHCLTIGRNTAGTKEQYDKGLTESGHEIGLRFCNDSELPELMHKAVTEDYSSMKSYAKDVVIKNYTIEENTTQIYNLYKKILGA